MQKNKNKNKGFVRNIVILLGILTIGWCLVSSYVLITKLPQHKNDHLPPERVFELPVEKPKSDPKPFYPVSDKFWSIESANPSEIRGLNWLEKGKLVVNKNLFYLKGAEGKTKQPESNITLVSGMLDLGRGHLKESFKRSFDHYVERFSRMLAYKIPKILYIQEEHYHLYLPYLALNPDTPVHFINITLDDIRKFPLYDEVQEIRNKPSWWSGAGWLKEAPQATMELYNPMVMSKLFMVRDAARLNPFNSDSFLWFDGGHNCNNPQLLNTENLGVFNDHFDKLLITFFDYHPAGEIHGFTEREFRSYIDVPTGPVRVGRGGIFGGTREYLDVACEVYLIAAEETLRKGLMGTEENLFSILHYRFPELVHDYQNGAGGDCGIITEAIYGPPPPPVQQVMVLDGLDLRKMTCKGRNDDITCVDEKGRECPAHVTPKWLTIADKQYSCGLAGSYCTVECRDGVPFWFAHSCGSITRVNCPPYPRVPYKQFYDDGQQVWPHTEKEHDEDDDHLHVHALPVPQLVEEPKPKLPTIVEIVQSNPVPVKDEGMVAKLLARGYTQKEIDYTLRMKANISKADLEMVNSRGWDLRTSKCELLNGKEVCFTEYAHGRDLCPEWVTSLHLTLAPTQWSCQQPGRNCRAICQEGVDRVHWGGYEVAWCEKQPPGSCPEFETIPFEEYVVREWSAVPAPPKPCDSLSLDSFPHTPFSVIVLTQGHEIPSMNHSLQSWKKFGLLEYADEVLVLVNKQTQVMDDFLAPYMLPPYNVKVLNNPENVGITGGLNYLFGNATNKYVLFLEKDFRLVESLSCTLDQIEAGIKLIETNQAEVVKYRSRYHPGNPNWADISYRGKEETVFARQPNLLCNFYHWIDDPVQRWPDKFRVCNEDPLFYCVDSYYCNWTNNPFLIDKNWWFDNYMNLHAEIRNPTPDFGLEGWMNWHPDSWKDRKWTIASGDGLFKHCDANNFGK